MSALTIRRLLVDLDTPMPRHWAGDAFSTAFFNALSMSFPAGEQLFIDSIRKGMAHLSPEQRAGFAEEVQGFIGQEATHRRIHQRFNDHLVEQGLVNSWELRILSRRPLVESIDVRNWVAVTAATEHLTAIFSEHLLHHPKVLSGASPHLRDMWLWHCSEETEHRSTAFEIYSALGGAHAWRCQIFRLVTRSFALDLTRQTLRNLWVDGTWWRPSTWVQGWRLLFGAKGLVSSSRQAWRRYLREDFHPDQADGTASQAWLREHAALVPPVRATA